MRLYKWLWLLPLFVLSACTTSSEPVTLETQPPPVIGATSEEAEPVHAEALSDMLTDPEGAEGVSGADGVKNVEPANAEPSNAEPIDDTSPDGTDALADIDYQAVKPNEVGNLMIIMYHGISDNNPPYDRTAQEFINDLNTLYTQGYRLISIHDLIDGRINIAPGYTPVVLTFDDSKSSTFSFIEQEGQLVPKPGTIVDILNRFCEEHPDFGKAATFYIIGSSDPFSGAGTVADRLNYLLDQGFDLGNHSWTHADLSRLNAEKIQEELGQVEALIREACPDYTPRTMTYPQGKRPKENLRGYALNGTYQDVTYQYVWGIREGQSTISANPYHVAFDPLNVPRVRASDDSTPDYDVQDLGYFLRYYESHPERRYRSDGNPDRVSVPKQYADLVNPDALGDKELYIYEWEES